MSYDPESCTVIYRSRMHKTLKRNFQVMHGADWLAQSCAHIPDRFEHLVRYAGWYSNRSRGKRRRMGAEPAVAPMPRCTSGMAATWWCTMASRETLTSCWRASGSRLSV